MLVRSLAAAGAVAAALAGADVALADPPRTGFEQREGAPRATHQEELQFLSAVGAGSPKARVSQIGTSAQGRPLHLVEIGGPTPAGRDAALNRPTALLTCTQHGNEPSGREACLQLLRDLAFDPAHAALVEQVTFLFIPTANPDGREADTRGNSDGTDVNRDHLTLDTPEARAAAKVVLDWQPDVALDLHEYGPSMPVIYDDSVLWLWPRNLNTDQAVHDLAITLGREYLVPSAEEAGYTTDEYGQYEVADNDIQQTAGDADEGIMRNAMGLRHVLGILVETRVDADVRQSPTEPASTAEVQRRRVASHTAVLAGLLRFMRERGQEAMRVTEEAIGRKVAEGAGKGAPIYFDGADNQDPTPEMTQAPPPCGYRLTPDLVTRLGHRLELHGIQLSSLPTGPVISLAQPAEPVIPLLVDRRGRRHYVEAEMVADGCPPPPAGAGGGPSAPRPSAPSPRCFELRTVALKVPRPKARGKVVRVKVTANGRRVRVRRRVAYVRLTRRGTTYVVRFTQRVRRGGKIRTVRATRRLRTC